jgi:Arylsulfotransferase (ASST)
VKRLIESISPRRPIVVTLALACACSGPGKTRFIDAIASQPWSEHEAQFDVTMADPATVAVACQLDGDPAETHLVEGSEESGYHQLRMAGLLAGSTYHCSVAAVSLADSVQPLKFDLRTDLESNPRLPVVHLEVQEDGASGDYIVTNHQVNLAWNGQRRLVIDQDANIRWHADEDTANSIGGSAVGYFPADQTFTLGGGWPPSASGRPQQIDLFGAPVSYDTLPAIPAEAAATFHHEARRLSDGRFLALSERQIQARDGGTFDGVGVEIVNPETNQVDFSWSSQAAYDAGLLEPNNNPDDSYHPNWANVYDNVLHVSLCGTKQIAAIDMPSGDLRWVFGAVGDWALVDVDGNPLGPDEFPECQHGSMREGNKLLIYDNGKLSDSSRVVQYSLDEATMVATKVWEWTEPDWHEDNLGGVDRMSNGDVLVSMCHLEDDAFIPGDHTTFVEVNPATGEKVWEIQYDDPNDMAFRSLAIHSCDIFANAKYCAQTRERLGQLASALDLPVSAAK